MVNSLALDYLSGSDADDMDLTGSGRKKKKKHGGNRPPVYVEPVYVEQADYEPLTFLQTASGENAQDAADLEAIGELEGSGKKKKKKKRHAPAQQEAFGGTPALVPGLDFGQAMPQVPQQGMESPPAASFARSVDSGEPPRRSYEAPERQYAGDGTQDFEAIGGRDSGDSGDSGQAAVDVAEFEDFPAPPRRRVQVEQVAEDDVGDDLIYDVQPSQGLTLIPGLSGSGCCCETYKRYPANYGFRNPQ